MSIEGPVTLEQYRRWRLEQSCVFASYVNSADNIQFVVKDSDSDQRAIFLIVWNDKTVSCDYDLMRTINRYNTLVGEIMEAEKT